MQKIHREALGNNPCKGAKQTELGREKLSSREVAAEISADPVEMSGVEMAFQKTS